MMRVPTEAITFAVVLGLVYAASAAAPIKLNGPLVAGGDVYQYAILRFSPDSTRVLYRADQTTDEVDEIFSVPVTGGTAIKLNGPLATGGVVDSARFSPDSTRVLYRADQTTNGVIEIFSVPSAGGTPVKLNGPLVATGDVLFYWFSPDSSRVLYSADQSTDDMYEIFSVPSAGGTPVKLNGPLVAGGDAAFGAAAEISPDSTRVVYRADQTTDEVDEIFSVPIAGGTAVKLNGPLAAGGDVTHTLLFSPDGSRVLYSADQTTNDVFEVFSVPSAGGAPVKLNGPLVAGGDVDDIRSQFSPNSTRVLYLADQTTNDVVEVFSVPSAGGSAIKLNGPLAIGGDVEWAQFSPDSSRVLYRADQTTNDVVEIFSVPSAGGSAIKLNGPLAIGGDVEWAQFSPDSSRLLYLADQTTNDVVEVFSVPSAGGTAVKLNGPLATGGDVSEVHFSPDSSRVLYSADQSTDEVGEVFIVPSGGGTAVKLNGPLVAGGDVSINSLQFSPDGSRVLYAADQEMDEVVEVYVRVIEARWNTGSANWGTNSNWNNGFAPDEVMQTLIDRPATVALTGTGRQAFSLTVGGGSGTSILELQSSAELTVINGLNVTDGGVLRGDGRVLAGSIGIASGGEVRAAAGNQLQFNGNLKNTGRVEAIGTAASPAEIEFDGAVVSDGGGIITGRNATFRFDGGLTNNGALAMSVGTSDVFGDIDNHGSIIVSGGAAVTFYDDVNQSATLQVSKVGSTTSVAVFFGAITGGSTGGGDIFIEGDLAPGSSPALATFENNVSLGAAANLEIELAGTSAGSKYDKVAVTGQLALNGTLAVSLINSFSPAAGNSFDILDWNTLSGTFNTISLPALGAGLMWNASQLYSTGTLRVNIAGDYNSNGIVDAADYVVWRKTPNNFGGDPEGHDTWRAHFGEPGGSGLGASANSTVPEPATCVMLMFAATGWCLRRRRKAWKVPTSHQRVTVPIIDR